MMPLSQETLELIKTLMKAHLTMAQAQNYIRVRMEKHLDANLWRVEELFELIDTERKGWIGRSDLERLLRNISALDVELLISLFDRSGTRVISLYDFTQELKPRV
jgi:Ca2+-binding EF-hand superfamily protein